MYFFSAEQRKARDRQLNSLNRSFSHLCRLTFPGGCRPLLFLSCMEAIHIQNNRILAQVESVENKASIGAEANTHTNYPEVLCLMTPAPASPGILPSHTVSTLDTLRETFPYGRPSPHRTTGGFATPLNTISPVPMSETATSPSVSIVRRSFPRHMASSCQTIMIPKTNYKKSKLRCTGQTCRKQSRNVQQRICASQHGNKQQRKEMSYFK